MKLLISANDVIGQLALNAVKQHPYHKPEGLFDLVEMILAVCDRDFKDGIEDFHTRWFESHELYAWVRSILPDDNPILMAWNTPKSGHAGHVFVSRYWGPTPDHDFIDIDALRMNIASGVWRDAVEYEKAA